MDKYNELTNLFQTEEFQNEAKDCKTMEDFQAAFKRHGIEMSMEEVEDIISKIAKRKQQLDNGEIPEDDLENVAGGVVGLAAVGACIGVGALCVGAFAVSAYVAHQACRWANKGK